jgi:hypothetical protein
MSYYPGQGYHNSYGGAPPQQQQYGAPPPQNYGGP